MKDIKLNFNLKQLSSAAITLLKKAARYASIIFIVSTLIAYSFLVWRINTLNQAKPSDDQLTEKLNDVRLPKIDQSVVDKLQQLEDNSVEVKALLENARENPFNE
jgi:hypothetical protein